MRTIRYTRRVEDIPNGIGALLGGSNSYIELSTEAIVSSPEEAKEAGMESQQLVVAFLEGLTEQMENDANSD